MYSVGLRMYIDLHFLGKIQKLVDDLNLHKYSNLAEWVSKLDVEVENRLIKRLEAGIREWTRVLLSGENQEVSTLDFLTLEFACFSNISQN